MFFGAFAIVTYKRRILDRQKKKRIDTQKIYLMSKSIHPSFGIKMTMALFKDTFIFPTN